jgi:hypothetical protein
VAILPHKQILSLHAAVVSAHLTQSHTALLGGLDPAFADGLPTCPNPSSQILSDLHGLNAAERLRDGEVPFTIWLGNALALVGERPEANVFQSAMARAEATSRPDRQPGTPQAGDEIADELARIGRAVLFARDHDLGRSLYEIEALIARCPHHVEARLLRERIKRAVGVTLEIANTRSLTGHLGVPFDMEVPIVERSRLPAPPSSFTGREWELVELANQIGPSGVLLSGLAGVGKTALALKLAHRLAPGYPDLQIRFDLKGTSRAPRSPAFVMTEVVRAYLPGVPPPERAEDLADLYRRVLQGQRALILLDDARDQAQIEPLLPPLGSALIVTSDRRIALPGVYLVSLEGLLLSDARTVLRSFAPWLEEPLADTIAELCGYVPIALQLAGRALSRRPDLTPEAYAERLREAQAQHALIDAALRVSFDLLDAVLQVVWCRLACFTSDFSESTALAAVSGGFLTIETALSDLVAYGLLEHEPVTERYSLHPAARGFAISRLRGAERDEAERRCEELEAKSSRSRSTGEATSVSPRG